MRADALASDLRSPASAHGVECTEIVPASTVVPGDHLRLLREKRVCVCVGGSIEGTGTLCAHYSLLLSPPMGCTAYCQSNPHGRCLVHTWLVHALHRYTQVPNPTLSTLREDQSTRLR